MHKPELEQSVRCRAEVKRRGRIIDSQCLCSLFTAKECRAQATPCVVACALAVKRADV